MNTRTSLSIAVALGTTLALLAGSEPAEAKSPHKSGVPALSEALQQTQGEVDKIVDGLCDGDAASCAAPACPCFDAVSLADYSTCVVSSALPPFRGRRVGAVAPGLVPLSVVEGVPNVCQIGEHLLGPLTAAEAAACADLILDELGPACLSTGP
jgi:hypothetical protein